MNATREESKSRQSGTTAVGGLGHANARPAVLTAVSLVAGPSGFCLAAVPTAFRIATDAGGSTGAETQTIRRTS